MLLITPTFKTVNHNFLKLEYRGELVLKEEKVEEVGVERQGDKKKGN